MYLLVCLELIYFYYIHIYTICMQCLWRPEEGIGLPGSEVTNSREPPCGFWGSKPGPLQEPPMLLTPELSISPSSPGNTSLNPFVQSHTLGGSGRSFLSRLTPRTSSSLSSRGLINCRGSVLVQIVPGHLLCTRVF